MNIIVDFYNLPEGVKINDIAAPNKVALFDFFETHAPGCVSQDVFDEWWDSAQAKSFFIDWHLVRRVVDNILNRGGITMDEFDWIKSLRIYDAAESFMVPPVAIKLNNPGETFIDLTTHRIELRFQSLYHLEIASIYRALYNELLDLLMKQATIRRCAASDCEKIFTPSRRGREQEYHSRRCYWRERDRKKRRPVK